MYKNGFINSVCLKNDLYISENHEKLLESTIGLANYLKSERILYSKGFHI